MKAVSRLVSRIIDVIVMRVSQALSPTLATMSRQFEDLMILQGRSLALRNADRAPLSRLEDAEFKVFSQFGEDGILQYLVGETAIGRDTEVFVEFGVESYVESNTRFLLQNNNWRGLIIDGSRECMDSVRQRDLYWRHDLTAVDAWIDRDSINHLIERAGITGDIGILSIDLDGNDYWVWERIDVVKPVIVVVEWNSVFGERHAVSIPYDPAFNRATAHYSCLYWGASIRALEFLAERKGYALIGSNTAATNLFFVRKDRLGRLKPVRAAEAYMESRCRDSRDERGRLNFLSGASRYDTVSSLPVFDVIGGRMTTLRELDEQCQPQAMLERTSS
jgi:hypothetical protein